MLYNSIIFPKGQVIHHFGQSGSSRSSLVMPIKSQLLTFLHKQTAQAVCSASRQAQVALHTEKGRHHFQFQHQAHLVACQGQVIGVIDEGVLQIPRHLIHAPVALHAEKVDNAAQPGAVHKAHHHQGNCEGIQCQHDQHHLSPGEREGRVCYGPTGQGRLVRVLQQHAGIRSMMASEEPLKAAAQASSVLLEPAEKRGA